MNALFNFSTSLFSILLFFCIGPITTHAQDQPASTHDTLNIRITYDTPAAARKDDYWKRLKKLAKDPSIGALRIEIALTFRGREERVFEAIVANQWDTEGQHDEKATIEKMNEQEKIYRLWISEQL